MSSSVAPAAPSSPIARIQCVLRAKTPEDLVGAVLFLASDASRFVTGQIINTDGGATHP